MTDCREAGVCPLDIAAHAATLPNAIVIGAMKCGTSALHRYLDEHPQVCMSEPKELNFFVDPCEENTSLAAEQSFPGGTWHRGIAWYASHFSADARVRGESSPGYTSPSHPGAATRMAAVVPEARLIYIVRDPIERAVSQYRHHHREGAEHRSPDDALLDPASQYVSRGLYHERLLPFLTLFPYERICLVTTEELRDYRQRTLARLFRFLEVDDDFWSEAFERQWHRGSGDRPALDDGVRSRLAGRFREDAGRLRELAGREFFGWTV